MTSDTSNRQGEHRLHLIDLGDHAHCILLVSARVDVCPGALTAFRFALTEQNLLSLYDDSMSKNSVRS